MNTLQQGLIALMKSAVTVQPYALPEGFDLEAAYPLIQKHHIDAMAYDGAVRCGIDRKSPAMQQLFQSYLKVMMKSEGQMRDVQAVLAAFDAQGIDYMPLKGCKMKGMYPKPELRVMGDADILIRVEQYEKIVPIMESLHFQVGLESDHELVWKSKGLYLELHKHLIPSYNKDFYAYFGEGWQLAKKERGTRYAMSPEDEWIFLFTHFAKHYRDGGIGCRYVTDLWVYRNTHPAMDEGYIRSILRKLYLVEFYENVLQLIDVWFQSAETNPKMDHMTDFIFSSGSWGTGNSRLLSRTVRDSKHSAVGFSGRLVYLWKTAFPDVMTLREKYTVLKKHPCLLPAVWIWRPIHKLLFERESLKKQRQNLQTVSMDHLQARQEALNYVGLDYNF